MTPQLDTVIIEASSVKVLRLRGNPTETMQGQTFAIMVTQGFTVAILAIHIAIALLHYRTFHVSTVLLIATPLLYNTK